MSTKTVYISIGNSDDRLTQRQWAGCIDAICGAIRNLARGIDGPWFSSPGSQQQTACWCVEVRIIMTDRLRQRLEAIAAEYQHEIAWAEATTEFIGPVGAVPDCSGCSMPNGVHWDTCPNRARP